MWTGENGGFQKRWRCDWLKSMASFRKSHITRQYACSMLAAIIFPPFLGLRGDERKRFEYAIRETSVFKIIRIRVDMQGLICLLK